MENRVKNHMGFAVRRWTKDLFQSLLFLIIFCSPLSPRLWAQNLSDQVSGHLSNKPEKPLKIDGKIAPFQLEGGQGVELQLNLSLPENYRAYADQFKIQVLSPAGFKLNGFHIEPLKEFYDQNTKKKKMGVINQAVLRAPMEVPLNIDAKTNELKIALTYQACTATYCLFPTDLQLSLPFEVKTTNVSTAETSPSGLDSFLSKDSLNQIFNHGIAWAFVFVFLAGLLTSFTPCIFPMIPITIAVLGKNAHLRTKGHNFSLSFAYVMGIAVTYAAMGVFAASTGQMFGSLMSHPITLSVMCLVFLLMALSMFGLFEIAAPLWLQNRLGGNLHVQGYSGAFIYGLVAGVVASPCVGPVLISILTYVAKTQNLWLGFWLLFTFALGMGQLFLVLGFSSQATKLLPKSGAWMDGVKTFFGLMMMGVFYYYLTLLVNDRVFDVLFGLGCVVGGSLLGAFSSGPFEKVSQKLKKGFCQAAIIFGAAVLTIGALNLRPLLHGQAITTEGNAGATSEKKSGFQKYSVADFEAALKIGKPIIIDFWADWCAACLELEKYTLSDPQFIEQTSGFALFKYDASADSEELEALRKKYEIMGLPHLVFIDTKGNWRKDLTVNQFIETKPMLEKVNQIKRQ